MALVAKRRTKLNVFSAVKLGIYHYLTMLLHSIECTRRTAPQQTYRHFVPGLSPKSLATVPNFVPTSKPYPLLRTATASAESRVSAVVRGNSAQSVALGVSR
jgi:hypothetical protein